MNKLIVFILLLFSTYSSIDQNSIENSKENEFTINHEDYTLRFEIEKLEDQNASLSIVVELHNGSSFISPFENREFKGKFYMDLGSYKNLAFDGHIIETPRSIEEFDEHSLVNELVNWVRVNTTYKQLLRMKSDEDFIVYGRVQFTIEPRCTFEEIPFAISYQDGVMKFIDPKC